MALFFLYAGAIFGVAALIAFVAEKMERDAQMVEDFARIMGVRDGDYTPVDDDPERKQADHDRWDRRKAQEEGAA